MGQKEVIDVLQNNGWLTKKQISEQLKNLCPTGINDSLARLIKSGFIEVKVSNELKHGYLYKLRDDLNE